MIVVCLVDYLEVNGYNEHSRADGKTVDRSGICIIHLERQIPRVESLVSHRGLRSREFIARLVTPMRFALSLSRFFFSFFSSPFL